MLDHAERIFDAGYDAGLRTFESLGQRLNRFGRIRRAAFTGTHGDVPSHVVSGISPLASALVAGVGKHLSVTGVQQFEGN